MLSFVAHFKSRAKLANYISGRRKLRQETSKRELKSNHDFHDSYNLFAMGPNSNAVQREATAWTVDTRDTDL